MLRSAARRLTRAVSLRLFLKRVRTSQNVVAFTFDDGPSPENTREVLAVLEKHRAKATFFMRGIQVERHPGLVREVVAKGHQVGNHSYSHPRMLFRSPAFVRREITRTDALLRAAGVTGDIAFRTPYGRKLVVLPYVLLELGKRDVLWDVDAKDTETQDQGAIQRALVRGIRPGSIVLLHDGNERRPGTLAALDETLAALAARGYRFLTVDDLLQHGC